jgi:superfamily II DNA or RNA helicase
VITLRDYQDQAVEEIRAALRAGHRSVLFQLCTGGGKTPVFSYLASKLKPGRRALILVHRHELLSQASNKLADFGIEHGIVSPHYHRSLAPIQVASVQTIINRLHSPEHSHYDLVIVDEAHHLPSASFRKVVEHYGEARRLCVTATPRRFDGKGLADFCSVLIRGPSMRWLAERDHLARCEVYGPPTQVDLSQVHTRMGDFIESELEVAVDKAVITGDAVEHYRKYVHGRAAIAFCISLKHCAHVAEQFRKGGYQAASIDGTMDPLTRKRIITDLAEGRLNVVTSCELLTEGLDAPSAQAAILLRPTQSLTLFLQSVGRAMRPKLDHSPCVILDHVRNCERHGLPDEDREWSLEGRVRTGQPRDEDQKRVAVRTCEVCYAVFNIALGECPKCHVKVIVKSREIRTLPGELVRLTLEQRKALWREEQNDPNVRLVRAKLDQKWETQYRERLLKQGRPRRQVEAIIDKKKREWEKLRGTLAAS